MQAAAGTTVQKGRGAGNNRDTGKNRGASTRGTHATTHRDAGNRDASTTGAQAAKGTPAHEGRWQQQNATTKGTQVTTGTSAITGVLARE
jgi:hypothetical protein